MSLPLSFLDKENEINIDLQSRKNENAENTIIRQKPTVSQLRKSGASGGPKRIPLGGKDSNNASSFPTLQRSQSSLQAETLKGGNNNPSILQRKKILLPKAPTLSKANSSLGFIHRRDTLLDAKPSVKHHLDTKDVQASKHFHSQNASRSKNLVDGSGTDTLVKQDAPQLPPVQNLKSTISENTNQLHSSYIPFQAPQLGDPTKGAKLNTKSLVDEDLLERLAEDPASIETLPAKPEPVYQIPLGLDPVKDDDVFSFLDTDSEPANHSEIYRNEVNLKFQEIDLDDPSNFGFDDEVDDDVANAGESGEDDLQNVGLTTADLNDLLDF